MTLSTPFHSMRTVLLLPFLFLPQVAESFVTSRTATVPLSTVKLPFTSHRVDKLASSLRVTSSSPQQQQQQEEQEQEEEGKEEESEKSSSSIISQTPEYAALLPGHRLLVQIGDTSLSRKAWKKRRRSDSPILIPVSVLGMHEMWSIRWNIIYLLFSYGNYDSSVSEGGVTMSVKRLVSLYESKLEGSLLDHAGTFGDKGLGYFIVDLFEPKVQLNLSARSRFPVTVEVLRMSDKLILSTNLSKRKAREFVKNVALAQVVPKMEGDEDFPESGPDTAQMFSHTGFSKKVSTEGKKNPKARGAVEPLSAALRVSPSNEFTYKTDDVLQGNIFSFDPQGDSGGPLLILTDGHHRNGNAVPKARISGHGKNTTHFVSDCQTRFEDLKVGGGPYEATVRKISSRAGAVFLDLGVGRELGKNKSAGMGKRMVSVWGMMRIEEFMKDASLLTGEDEEDTYDDEMMEQEVEEFMDINIDDLLKEEEIEEIEEEEEIVEDVTNMFDLTEDGTISSLDPISGESTILGSILEDPDDDIEEEQEDDQLFTGMSADERLDAINEMLLNDEQKEQSSTRHENKSNNKYTSYLQTGQTLPVYIRQVSRQSGRFMVSLRPHSSQSLKQLRTEKNAEKRLAKFSTETMEIVRSSVGKKCKGIVKAKSKTDERMFYVLPVGVEGLDVVGVAKCDEEADAAVVSSIEKGDEVDIVLDGFDEMRGQLGMTLTGKC